DDGHRDSESADVQEGPHADLRALDGILPKLAIVDEPGGARVDNRRDAVIQTQIRVDAEQAAFVPVAVQINQAWTKVVSADVELRCSCVRGNLTDRGDAPVADRHIHAAVQPLRRINDVRVPE